MTAPGPGHIGIVGCSAEGASLCYRTICTEGPALLGPNAHPQVTLHTPSLAEYVHCLDSGDLQGVADLMLASAHLLADAGADVLICPDNTIHQAFDRVAPRSPLPWLHIAEVTADEAHRRDVRKAAVLGTRWLVESDVHPGKLEAAGIGHLLPEPSERAELHRIIMDELVQGRFLPDSKAWLHSLIDNLGNRGADAVILGCTELPLVVEEHETKLPLLDSTRLLARAALEQAVPRRLDVGKA